MQLAGGSDFELPQAPGDTVSSLATEGSKLAASSWSKEVRVWEVQSATAAVPRAMAAYPEPVLGCAFDGTGSTLFSGGTDGVVRAFDLGSNSSKELGKHEAAVKECAWSKKLNMVVTGSWDKTLKWWDGRSPTPAAIVQLPERCYALDINDNLMVVGCADGHIASFDLSKPQTIFGNDKSALKYETRSVACFPDRTGYAIGSSEGRVTIQHVSKSVSSKNFSFKCHRDTERQHLAYPVNAIQFHPMGTFVTAGGDGRWNTWDKENRNRVKMGPQNPIPITAATFAGNGTVLIYALGYDWYKGVDEYERMRSQYTPKIKMHSLSENEVKLKK